MRLIVGHHNKSQCEIKRATTEHLASRKERDIERETRTGARAHAHTHARTSAQARAHAHVDEVRGSFNAFTGSAQDGRLQIVQEPPSKADAASLRACGARCLSCPVWYIRFCVLVFLTRI
eukprot:5311898-Amphidinium_carterae.1